MIIQKRVFETTDTGAALTGTLTATGQLTLAVLTLENMSDCMVVLVQVDGIFKPPILDLRISDNDTTGSVVIDRAVSLPDGALPNNIVLK